MQPRTQESQSMPRPLPHNAWARPRRRARFGASQRFYLVVLIATVLAAFSLLKSPLESRPVLRTNTVARRSIPGSGIASQAAPAGILVRRDEECRLVHSAQDQCAFVRRNCPDEEAGLLSYLQLYYCNLSKAKPIAFIILVVWLGLLFSTIGIAASDFFCIDLSTIASILGMSESMAGVTFLALGNGSPDVFSTFAAIRTHSGSLAVGELIGAAGFITSVVAGSMALVRPFKVARKSFVRDVGFFIVAAGFSMVFLADGHLDLWECAAMVGFYVFYVVIVVVWHWTLSRRSNKRRLEEAARSHFHTPGAEHEDIEPYHDEDDEETRGTNRQLSRPISANDFSSLERGSSPLLRSLDQQADADDDDTRDRYMAEISGNMRVSRPKRGDRRSTRTPIRPSLVGALEFRAVLSSLQRSRSIQPIPITIRRHSEDPAMTLSQQANLLKSPGDAFARQQRLSVGSSDAMASETNVHYSRTTRSRAKSANDAERVSQGPGSSTRPPEPQMGHVRSSGQPGSEALDPRDAAQENPSGAITVAPQLSVPSSDNQFGYLASSPLPISPLDHARHNDLLAPPEDKGPSAPPRSPAGASASSTTAPSNLGIRPTMPKLEIPSSTGSSQRSSPLSPFPPYYDDPDFVPTASPIASIHLPPPSVSPESSFHPHLFDDQNDKAYRWWPYKALPPPNILISTLFPTLYCWQEKNIWEKILGIVSAPSVFLLVMTLPVVEMEREEDVSPDLSTPGHATLSAADPGKHATPTTIVTLPPDSPGENADGGDGARNHSYVDSRADDEESPAINITPPSDQNYSIVMPPTSLQGHSNGSPALQSDVLPPASFKGWNRWLVIIQIFTAPLFILLIVHMNMYPEEPRRLILPTLIVLIGSLTLTAVLLLLTTPDRTPKLRYLLCFVGFIVSIAWISTIAGEVVGVLKALGIIFNISDAILGLTIFAVGNSLGDLVADITVARLGYPVMALSACFGGPMLNILLGIGLSGLYMTVRGEERRHKKHPDWPIKYKPYEIEVGGTLLISGVALLVTLLGLIVIVPLRGWWMDRRVGYGLIALWSLSTIVNVAAELMGFGKEI